ncbi:MAG: hypothetical protein IPN34_24045 [Planctomycetes bacterium]|nr:hypothetical protein [Planctomycetota bacterium]
MRSLDRSLLGAAAALVAGALWVLAPAEAPPRLDPSALEAEAGPSAGSPGAPWLAAAHRSASDASRSAPATLEGGASAEPSPTAEGLADLAVLVLGPAGPSAEQRLELWRLESASGSTEGAPEENLIALGVDSTDARGWLLWPALPYGRYLICLPPAPGQRGYRGPGVTGRRLLELEHRAELLAERVLELQP